MGEKNTIQGLFLEKDLQMEQKVLSYRCSNQNYVFLEKLISFEKYKRSGTDKSCDFCEIKKNPKEFFFVLIYSYF